MHRTLHASSLLAWITLVAAVGTSAGDLRAGTIRDDGSFFSPDTEQRVQQTLDRIQQRHGKNVFIETYDAPPASVPTGGGEAARDQAFNRWMISRGKELGADVLVLITKNPSHLQVGSSDAMKNSGAFTADDYLATRDQMLPLFKQRNFDEGIIRAVDSIERRLAQNTGPERAPAPARSGSSGAQTYPPGYPPPPGSGSSNRTSTPQPTPTQVGCGGGGIGSLVCLAIVVIGAFMLLRGMMARRSGYGGGPVPGGPGYGQPGYGGYGGGGGGGFGSGFGGGLLGGLLSGWLFNRTTHGGGGAFGGGPPVGGGLPPTDPSNYGGGGEGFSSAGGDFGGGGGGGGDFGGGGGGGDAGNSAGGDF
jgi:hypothetical protein